MGSFASVHPDTIFPRITFEQLEERIVLDGAVDDISCRVDLFSAKVGATHTDSDQIITEAVLAESGADVDSLVLETGTEWLPDGTWHYWEQDWDGSGNGYRFDAWEDGSSSFHQVQWDADANSKGTHNGFDYNLQKDGSWTYQSVQWDQDRDGYSYDATSGGTYHYETHQWTDGFGYDYTANYTGNWTYHTVNAGNDPGDQVFYISDSTGWSDFTYRWANGFQWHKTVEVGETTFHVFDGSWIYQYQSLNDCGYWKLITSLEATYYYNYSTGQWFHQGASGGWSELGESGLSPDFLGDGEMHDIGVQGTSTWDYQLQEDNDSGIAGVWGNQAYHQFDPENSYPQFSYLYSSGTWLHAGCYDLQQTGGTANSRVLGNHLSADFVGDGEKHSLNSELSYQYAQTGNFNSDEGIVSLGQFEIKGKLRFAYSYISGGWLDTSDYNTEEKWAPIEGYPLFKPPDLIFDGSWHDLVTDRWAFMYDSTIDSNHYSWDDTGQTEGPVVWDYYYYYNTGKWRIKEHINGENVYWDSGTGFSSDLRDSVEKAFPDNPELAPPF